VGPWVYVFTGGGGGGGGNLDVPSHGGCRVGVVTFRAVNVLCGGGGGGFSLSFIQSQCQGKLM